MISPTAPVAPTTATLTDTGGILSELEKMPRRTRRE